MKRFGTAFVCLSMAAAMTGAVAAQGGPPPGKGKSQAAKAKAAAKKSQRQGTPQAGKSGKSKAGKLTLCHKTDSAEKPWVKITVSANALKAHKAHGDMATNGSGPTATCPGGSLP